MDDLSTTFNFLPYGFKHKKKDPDRLAYLAQWHKLMGGKRIEVDEYATDNYPWLIPFYRVFATNMNCHHLTPHHARMISGFVMYLGSLSGQEFLDDAARFSAKLKGVALNGNETAYMAAWSDANKRFGPEDRNKKPRNSFSGSRRNPKNDWEVQEYFVRWLGREEGQAFTASVQKLIQRRPQQP